MRWACPPAGQSSSWLSVLMMSGGNPCRIARSATSYSSPPCPSSKSTPRLRARHERLICRRRSSIHVRSFKVRAESPGRIFSRTLVRVSRPSSSGFCCPGDRAVEAPAPPRARRRRTPCRRLRVLMPPSSDIRDLRASPADHVLDVASPPHSEYYDFNNVRSWFAARGSSRDSPQVAPPGRPHPHVVVPSGSARRRGRGRRCTVVVSVMSRAQGPVSPSGPPSFGGVGGDSAATRAIRHCG